jgi:hypothetical protein
LERVRKRLRTKDLSSYGPIRRERLTDEQQQKARDVSRRFAHLLLCFEQLEYNFLRDLYPDRELAVWESMAETFEQYQRPAGVSDKGLAEDILAISLGNTQDKSPELVKLYHNRLHHHLPGDSGLMVVCEGRTLALLDPNLLPPPATAGST